MLNELYANIWVKMPIQLLASQLFSAIQRAFLPYIFLAMDSQMLNKILLIENFAKIGANLIFALINLVLNNFPLTVRILLIFTQNLHAFHGTPLALQIFITKFFTCNMKTICAHYSRQPNNSEANRTLRILNHLFFGFFNVGFEHSLVENYFAGWF